MTLETKSIGLRVVGDILALCKAFYCKGSLSLMISVTIRTILTRGRFMQVSAVLNFPFNVPVTLEAVARRAWPLNFQERWQAGPVGIVAFNTSAMGRTAVGSASFANIQMALPTFEGWHLRWVAVRVVAVPALVFLKG